MSRKMRSPKALAKETRKDVEKKEILRKLMRKRGE